MSLKLHLPDHTPLTPCITVFGVGGAGGNAIDNMIQLKLAGEIRYIAGNTDQQALLHSLASKQIQLGLQTTKGLGAGASPDVGKAAAEESAEEIIQSLTGTNILFITAGMGGGTGTGGAPVIARLAREQGILTVGVVTTPFHFEGTHRMRMATQGIEELEKHVDTLIVIPNQNLFRVSDEKTTFGDAFKMGDNVLYLGVRGITDLMVMPGLINLDYADVYSTMAKMGRALMGTGEGEGPNRAIDAAEAAISNPLLDDVSLQGARGVLINITGGADMTLFELDAAAQHIKNQVDPDAKIIFGSAFNPELEGKIRVSVVAAGMDLSKKNTPSADKKSVSATPPVAPVAERPSVSLPFEQENTSSMSHFKEEKTEDPFNYTASFKNKENTETDVFQKTPVQENTQHNYSSFPPSPHYTDPYSYKPRFTPQKQTAYASSSYAENNGDVTSQFTQQKPEEKQSPTPPRSIGLFGRMNGAVRAVRDHMKEEAPSPRTHFESENLSAESQEDLEIPTYLRKRYKVSQD